MPGGAGNQQTSSRQALGGGYSAYLKGKEMVDLMLLIGGRAIAASNGATFERLNPITGQLATKAAAATLEDAHAAAAAAAAAFPAWSALAPTERRKRLSKAADILDSRTGEFIAA